MRRALLATLAAGLGVHSAGCLGISEGTNSRGRKDDPKELQFLGLDETYTPETFVREPTARLDGGFAEDGDSPEPPIDPPEDKPLDAGTEVAADAGPSPDPVVDPDPVRNPCTPIVRTSAVPLSGSAAAIIDGDQNTSFTSSSNDWQYVELQFQNCFVDVHSVRRNFESLQAGRTTRGVQGEYFSYSADGVTFSRIQGNQTSGWNAYVSYSNGTAWNELPYGWSEPLVMKEPLRVQTLRFHWDGNEESLTELDIDWSIPMRLDDVRFTQSGVVARAMPPVIIAGKTAMLRANLADFGVTTTGSASLRVVREDTGRVIGTMPGYSFIDDATKQRSIESREAAHFFIPGDILAPAIEYRLEVRVEDAAGIYSQVAARHIAPQENEGLAMVFMDYDDGLAGDPDGRALNRFLLATFHMARALPVKDDVGELLPRGTPTAGALAGLRYRYVANLPLAARGQLGDPEREFLMRDLMVGTQGPVCGSDAPILWSGKAIAFNFTYSEDTNGDGTIDPSDSLLCSRGGLDRRITNLGNKFIADRENQLRLAGRGTTEAPRYGMVLVSGGPNGQNRTGFLGNAIGWSTIGGPDEENNYPVVLQEWAHIFIPTHAAAPIAGPAYDLFLQRRVSQPYDVMAGGMASEQTWTNSFFNDRDWDTLVRNIPAASR